MQQGDDGGRRALSCQGHSTIVFLGSKISFKDLMSSICGFSYHQPVTDVKSLQAFSLFSFSWTKLCAQ